MNQKFRNKMQTKNKITILVLGIAVLGTTLYLAPRFNTPKVLLTSNGEVEAAQTVAKLNTTAYDLKLQQIANNPVPADGTISATSLWPVKTVYPNAGALLPFNRIVAYYGNLYSRNMGVLGEYSEEVMLQKLDAEVKKWQSADPATPVIPALHYIAIVAQAGSGRDGKYRSRMPDSEIQKVLTMAQKINAVVFLDIQVGQSNVQSEVPALEKYLKLPNVHLGIDPEFAMHGDIAPGRAIGTLDAADINFAANYLAKVVKDNNLTPKILIVHRFTRPMLTNTTKITPLPEVQIVIDMDGFGGRANKINTYKQYVAKEPVQFTGFKLFYHNDSERPGGMLKPEDILKLTPAPSYIQYQ